MGRGEVRSAGSRLSPSFGSCLDRGLLPGKIHLPFECLHRHLGRAEDSTWRAVRWRRPDGRCASESDGGRNQLHFAHGHHRPAAVRCWPEQRKALRGLPQQRRGLQRRAEAVRRCSAKRCGCMSPSSFSFEGDTKIDLIVKSIPEWYQLGCRIFGGCCRVQPAHIRRISEAVRSLNAKNCTN